MKLSIKMHHLELADPLRQQAQAISSCKALSACRLEMMACDARMHADDDDEIACTSLNGWACRVSFACHKLACLAV